MIDPIQLELLVNALLLLLGIIGTIDQFGWHNGACWNHSKILERSTRKLKYYVQEVGFDAMMTQRGRNG